MRVLVTGSSGYIGAVLVPFLGQMGHEVEGLDLGLYQECGFRAEPPAADRRDVRELSPADLEGFDAVVHLAALSNDPLGNLTPDLTYEINHRASVKLAEAAKSVGITRFVFASSCSLYGAGQDGLVDETAPMAPVTPYGETKAMVEDDLRRLADDNFSPTYMRNATVYGVSASLRLDVVVNNLSAWAVSTGEVVLQSDGTPWRPQVHVQDVSRSVGAVLAADRSVIHDEAFNVGSTKENFQIRDLAFMVGEAVEGSKVVVAPDATGDNRSYRVDFSKLADRLPAAAPQWTVRKGIDELVGAFREQGLTTAAFTRFTRLAEIRRLLDLGRLGEDLQWL